MNPLIPIRARTALAEVVTALKGSEHTHIVMAGKCLRAVDKPQSASVELRDTVKKLVVNQLARSVPPDAPQPRNSLEAQADALLAEIWKAEGVPLTKSTLNKLNRAAGGESKKAAPSAVSTVREEASPASLRSEANKQMWMYIEAARAGGLGAVVGGVVGGFIGVSAHALGASLTGLRAGLLGAASVGVGFAAFRVEGGVYANSVLISALRAEYALRKSPTLEADDRKRWRMPARILTAGQVREAITQLMIAAPLRREYAHAGLTMMDLRRSMQVHDRDAAMACSEAALDELWNYLDKSGALKPPDDLRGGTVAAVISLVHPDALERMFLNEGEIVNALRALATLAPDAPHLTLAALITRLGGPAFASLPPDEIDSLREKFGAIEANMRRLEQFARSNLAHDPEAFGVPVDVLVEYHEALEQGYELVLSEGALDDKAPASGADAKQEMGIDRGEFLALSPSAAKDAADRFPALTDALADLRKKAEQSGDPAQIRAVPQFRRHVQNNQAKRVREVALPEHKAEQHWKRDGVPSTGRKKHHDWSQGRGLPAALKQIGRSNSARWNPNLAAIRPQPGREERSVPAVSQRRIRDGGQGPE